MLSPAKINLSLNVHTKRADGYHMLSGLVAFADVGDDITVRAADTLTLEIDGPYGAKLPVSNNLVLRAATALQVASGVQMGAYISLTKNLPIASGMGGGSSNAATTLRLLAELWDVDADVAAIASTLGADVPMCLHGRACFVQGVGDEITQLPTLPPLHAVLVNPQVAVPTPAVFEAGFDYFSEPIEAPHTGFTSQDDVLIWLRATANDLTDNAVHCAPCIADVLAALEAQPTCQLARMSGSGATCFGLFKTQNQAEAAAENLQQHQPNWWVVATNLA